MKDDSGFDEKVPEVPLSQEEITGSRLLERTPDEEYLQEWEVLLAKVAEPSKEAQEIPVVVFRLAKEWLALSALVFAEVAIERPIHRLPHLANPLLLGMVNLRGQLRICISLQQLFEIEHSPKEIETPSSSKKFILAVQHDGDFWGFPVDEVEGVCRFEINALENVPVTVVKSSVNYLKGVMIWKGKSVGLIDEALLFYSLKKKVW